MQALVPTADSAATVVLSEVDEPRPVSDEIVVAVEAFSINRGETFLLERPEPGWRPGKDIAGIVLEPAASGRGPQRGARVVAHPGGHGWAQRAVVAAGDLAELPAELTAVTAAALPLAGLTALRLLRRAGTLDGRRLLITGASGGVGHYVVELAAGAGAEVTAVSASADRGTRLRELGAAHVVTDVADAQGRFDVVMESVGGRSFTDALRLVAEDGLLLWFGQAGREPATMDFFSFFQSPIRIRIEHFHYVNSDRSIGEDLATLVDLVKTGRLHPEIGLVRPWTDTAEAIADLRNRKIRGNAVLTINPPEQGE